MNKIQQKISYLKWLKSIGVTYYCSTTRTGAIQGMDVLDDTKKSKTNTSHQHINNILDYNNNVNVVTTAHKKDVVGADVVLNTDTRIGIRAITDGSSDSTNRKIANTEYMTNTMMASTTSTSTSTSKMLPHLKIVDIEQVEASMGSTLREQAALSRPIADQADSLEALKAAIESFNGCSLKLFAKNTVFADGISKAPIMLIGEAPGETEDAKGIPFCGESGQLLDVMLATINLSRRHNLYISNTVFWRPPANRKPTAQEIAVCRPFVEKHIALIQPQIIILVGKTATASVLGKEDGMSILKQNNYLYKNKYLTQPILTTVLFHPAYLLRQPMQKKNNVV